MRNTLIYCCLDIVHGMLENCTLKYYRQSRFKQLAVWYAVGNHVQLQGHSYHWGNRFSLFGKILVVWVEFWHPCIKLLGWHNFKLVPQLKSGIMLNDYKFQTARMYSWIPLKHIRYSISNSNKTVTYSEAYNQFILQFVSVKIFSDYVPELYARKALKLYTGTES